MGRMRRIHRQLALAVCLAVGVSALVGVVLCILNTPAPAYFTLGFELVIVLACGFGAWSARQRDDFGVAMAILIAAGTVAVGSYLGYLGAGKVLMGMGLKWPVLARLLCAGVLGVCAAVEVLRHNPRPALRQVLIGCVLLAPVVVVGALLWRGVGMAQLTGAPWMVRTVVVVAGFIVLMALVCAGVHNLIRAFERALTKADQGSGDGS